MVAVLAAVPALTATHGHRIMAGVVIGLQVVLLVIALTLLAKSKRLAEKQE